jgi:tRNA-splicing ligase RtcB
MKVWNNEEEGRRGIVKGWLDGVELEDEALRQAKNAASLPFVHRHVALMPDAHSGKGATVGSVIPTKGAIISAAVGVDLGCVDAETEYLSPKGWRKISEYDGGQVMQYDAETGVAGFVEPLAFIKKPSRGFLYFKTKYGVDQMVSPDHRMLCWKITGRDRRRVQTVMLASDVASEHERLVIGFKAEFQTTFIPDITTQLLLTDEQLRVQVALMADGHLDRRGNGAVTLNFVKQRKKDRLAKLLDEANISFTRNEYERVTSFRFQAPIATKTYGDFWSASLHQLEIIADECLYWDGNAEDNVFFTRDKASADFIQYAFCATGRRGTMRADADADGDTDYRVFANPNALVGIGGSPKSPVRRVESADGLEYCFTVPTGFWVMRRGGNVVMTGNCGMMAVQTSLVASDLPDNLSALRAAIEAAVPHGRTDNGGANDRGSWSTAPDAVVRAMADTLGERYMKIARKHPKAGHIRSAAQLGTLGTGNHFIEVCLDEQGRVWIMLHSGSRGPGNRIGTYFIEKAKEEMRRWFINIPDIDLAYLPEGSELFDDYVEAVGWAQDYARINRELMMNATQTAIARVLGRSFVIPVGSVGRFADTLLQAVNCHHNYVDRENHFGENVWVTRKGAVRARKGDLGIIPGSMGAKSFIVRGKGNPDSFESCSHGAGRRMSRTAAKKMFSLAMHEEATRGVECRKDVDVIDETPYAYKNIDDVMSAQADLVEVVHTLKQVLCVKG